MDKFAGQDTSSSESGHYVLAMLFIGACWDTGHSSLAT